MFSGRWTACAALCLVILVTGCSDDDEPEAEGPPESPSSSDTGSPTEPTSPTDEPTTVAPATGPELAVKKVSLRMPEGWALDNDDASYLVVGASENDDVLIYLSSFPSLDPDASLKQLAQSSQRTGGYPPKSVQPEATMAGRPAYHVAGRVAGDFTEEFGLLHDGEIVSVKFVLWSGPKTGWQEMIESVLATVELG